MKILKLTILSALLLVIQANAQHMFTVLYDNAIHVVNEADQKNYTIITSNGEEFVSIKNSKVRVVNTQVFLPGYINIEDETYTPTEYDDQQRKVGGSFYIRYNAKVTSSRDLDAPYLIFKWEKDEKNSYTTTVPLPPLKKDEQKQLSLRFYAIDRYRLIDPEIYYMDMGFEIGTSKIINKPITPYEYCLQQAGGKLPDGDLKPLQLVPNPTIKDADGNKREGSVDMLIEVDELGYVKTLKVQNSTGWVFAKSALMTTPFCLFQPRIVDGKPVSAKVVMPIKF